MKIKLYNSNTKSKELFVPIDPKKVTMYVCGPTVYSYPHIGNARGPVIFDVLARLLRREFDLTYIRNITDLDDKIYQAADDEGVHISEVTQRYTKIYQEDMTALGVEKPDLEPLATEHIPEMIEMIQVLIDKKHAYENQGHVFFSVETFDDYGFLSNRTEEEQISGTRIKSSEIKNNQRDFVLWKPSTGETPGWDSPWGFGRPGWHLECSVMSKKFLGDKFDIHGGGMDLIFPHHENEIAQSKGAHPKEQFVKYWLHNGMLNLSGKKMSKSDGNVKLLNEYIDEFSGPILRFFFLKSQYRSPQEFNVNLLKESESTLNNLIDFTYGVDSELKSKEVLEIFEHSMNEDLNTPKMLGSLFKLINESDRLNEQKLLELKSSIKFVFNLLGFDLIKVENNEKTDEELTKFFKKYDINFENVNQAVSEFINKREDLRKQKDFASADKMRESILGIGISLEDGTDSGWSWKNS